MKVMRGMVLLVMVVAGMAVVFSGCNESKSDAKAVEVKAPAKVESAEKAPSDVPKDHPAH